MIGKTLAHYRIIEKIGAGGMGEVYRAMDSKLGREVALKILPPAFAADPERLARFRREARLLAQLNHTNIGSIYGVEETAGVQALALELVEGPTLADVMQKGSVPIPEALPIALQIAEAVEAAHESGVVHRDLKPTNVKMTADGRCKVLDFGLAKALEEEAASGSDADSPTVLRAFTSPVTGPLTRADVILGTAAYMSPEQARGRAVDKRADIWAFGVLLFEMLSGRTLFAGETVSDTLAAVLKTDPPWDALPPDVPPPITRLIRRCLVRDPRKRLRDIGDARIVIAEWLADPQGADTETAAPPSRRAPAPSRRWFAPVLFLLGALSGAAIAWLAKPPPARTVERFLVPSAVAHDWPSRHRISPDGRRLAYIVSDRLYIQDLDRIGPRLVEGSDGARRLFWSPDGSMIGFHRGRKLWKADAAGGPPTVICDLQSMREASWRPDGTLVFDVGRFLCRVSARGGEVDTIAGLPEKNARDLHGSDVLPNNRGYVVVAHYGDRTNALEAWTESGERKTILASTDATLFSPRYADPGFLLYERTGSNEGIWAVPFSPSRLATTGDPFLIEPDGRSPSVSREGTLVLTPGGSLGDPQLAWVDLDSLAVTSIGQSQERIRRPQLSPDRSKVVAVGEEDGKNDLWIHDIRRSTKTRLTFADGEEAAPIWSPDGGTIYFTFGDSVESIFRVSSDGLGEPEELTAGGYASLSSDGKWMAFERRTEATELDLWKWRLDGTNDPEVFLATPAAEQNIELSPDGRWAAYQSNESGHDEIYLRPFPSGPGKWQVSAKGGIYPRWSPEGDRLFFLAGNELYRVEVEVEGGLGLSTPEPVVDGAALDLVLSPGWAVAPGGDRILTVWRPRKEGIDLPPPGLVVVRNWPSRF